MPTEPARPGASGVGALKQPPSAKLQATTHAALARAACVVAWSLALGGCFSAPTPLAPGLAGSVGMPSLGVQTGAAELPAAGKGFVRYRPRGKNHWGRPRLVSSLQRIAAEIDAELPGGSLVIGDLGAQSGGKIPGHASHR